MRIRATREAEQEKSTVKGQGSSEFALGKQYLKFLQALSRSLWVVVNQLNVRGRRDFRRNLDVVDHRKNSPLSIVSTPKEVASPLVKRSTVSKTNSAIQLTLGRVL